MEIPQNVTLKAEKALGNLLPVKSKHLYEKEYDHFLKWKDENTVNTVNETVLMAYFQELSEQYSANSLWTKYSQLKSMFIVKENINISAFSQLMAFLEVNSKGYIPEKSKVLEGGQVLLFIRKAPDDTFLLHKVVLVMGVFRGLRRDEMVKMTVDDIEDRGVVLLIMVPETKTCTSKSFTIVEGSEIGALNLVEKYIALQPKGCKQRRFFLTYRNNKCMELPVGKKTIGSVPSIIAKYLNLENSKGYTGHCLRRTSSTLLVQGGASFETLKLHGKWKSSTVAESYIEGSIYSKNKIATMIAYSVSEKENVNVPNETECTLRSSSSVNSQNFKLGTNFSGTFENCNFYLRENNKSLFMYSYK